MVIRPGLTCFVAGSPVWTRRGLVPIDQVQLGDLVLSMNPETGELAYQPVVYRTLRPSTKMLRLNVGYETIGTTLGHPFWVSGEGWVRAVDLTAGQPLRGCGEILRLGRISQAKEDLGYNLEVAEFKTYFVGRNKILVHDNTPITDPMLPVPGLVRTQ